MKLCMFSTRDPFLERGWPGRLDGDRVIQLAAQTLQSFFTGGGQAREHAAYPLADIVFRAPVLHPPSIRVFDDTGDFAFANPAAIRAIGEEPGVPGAEQQVERVAAIIGADGAIGGFTPFLEWVAPQLHGAKQHDFALTLRFDVNRYWLIKAEGHYMRGTAGLSSSLNGNQPLGALTPDWALFAVKTTAYF